MADVLGDLDVFDRAVAADLHGEDDDALDAELLDGGALLLGDAEDLGEVADVELAAGLPGGRVAVADLGVLGAGAGALGADVAGAARGAG